MCKALASVIFAKFPNTLIWSSLPFLSPLYIESYFSHLQLQSSVHLQCAFLHEQFPPQPLALLHPHLTSSLQALLAMGRLFQTGHQDFVSVSSVQPQPSAVGVCCWAWSHAVQIPAWYATRFVCCSSVLCWRNLLHRPVLLAEELLAYCVHRL